MTIYQMTENLEIKLWNVIIPFMDCKGPMMKIITLIKHVYQSKIGYLILLIFVWAKIGFFSGLIIGRLIGMLQLL